MEILDLFAEFANAPPAAPTIRKNRTVDQSATADHSPDIGKMVIVTTRMTYKQEGKEMKASDRKSGRFERTELRGFIYETLLQNLYWRFKRFALANANEFVTYAFMRKMLSHDEALAELTAIETLVHSQCKDGQNCRHIGKPTWHEHLNNCLKKLQ